jgi:hypothetical protein
MTAADGCRPECLEEVRVALVGYRDHDGGQRVERVDVIDVRAAVSLISLTPADARALAERLREAAGWSRGDSCEPIQRPVLSTVDPTA